MLTTRGRQASIGSHLAAMWPLLPFAALLACGGETVTPPPAPVRLAFVAQPGTAVVAASLVPALQVAIQDAQGRTVTTSTASVTMAITSGTGAAGAGLVGTAVRNAVGGVATFDDIRIDRVGAGYALTASSPALTSATSAAFDVNAGAATKVVFTVQPTSVVSGSPVAPAVQATLQDALGNVAAASTAVVTLTLNTGSPGTGAVLGGTASRPTVNGVAVFNDLFVDKAGVNYTLAASAAGLTGSSSAPFAVGPGAANKVAFISQPGSVVAGLLMAAAPRVSVQDAQGNTVTSSTIPIALSLQAGTGAAGARLEGGLAQTPLNGSATFRGLAIDRRGMGYVLTASAQGLTSAMSNPFDVTGVPGGPNYILLASDAEDPIGGGATHRYTLADAILSVDAPAAQLSVAVDGDASWVGEFRAPDSLSRLQQDVYTDLDRWPFHVPARGGLSWYGDGRGCNTLKGDFAVDSVVYRNGVLAAVDLRFVQRCDGATAALRGIVHWSVDDPTVPPGPVLPIPDTLWKPAPGLTPATGTYVYLESAPGDFVGQGIAYSYLPGDTPITAQLNGGVLRVTVGQFLWVGTFASMQHLSALQPGFYGGVTRHPFHNRAKGGLSWSGFGRGCNKLTGWFAIDGLTMASGAVSSVDVRFEQHCEGAQPALRGALRWVR